MTDPRCVRCGSVATIRHMTGKGPEWRCGSCATSSLMVGTGQRQPETRPAE